jgi:hypothetical protein
MLRPHIHGNCCCLLLLLLHPASSTAQQQLLLCQSHLASRWLLLLGCCWFCGWLCLARCLQGCIHGIDLRQSLAVHNQQIFKLSNLLVGSKASKKELHIAAVSNCAV